MNSASNKVSWETCKLVENLLLIHFSGSVNSLFILEDNVVVTVSHISKLVFQIKHLP